MFQFDKINIEYLLAVLMLGAALLLGIVYGDKELAINIASGLIGYIGGTLRSSVSRNFSTDKESGKNDSSKNC